MTLAGAIDRWLVLIGLMTLASEILPSGLNQELLAASLALLIRAVDYFEGGELVTRTEYSFTITICTYVRSAGRQLNEKMSRKYYLNMSDDELEPIWLFLKTGD